MNPHGMHYQFSSAAELWDLSIFHTFLDPFVHAEPLQSSAREAPPAAPTIYRVFVTPIRNISRLVFYGCFIEILIFNLTDTACEI